jgi:F-type H+-transporting ATPase subunit b
MLIDWFTVAAQIVNFLLLVWLLKHFLYSRIIRAIDARESKIAARLAEADQKEQEAERQRSVCQAKLDSIDKEREEILAQARVDAERLRAGMLEKARQNVQALETRWRDELQREQNAFFLDLRKRAAVLILTVARRALADLASMDLQKSAVKAFAAQIRGMNDQLCKRLANGDIEIRSAFDLAVPEQSEIQRAIDDRFGVVLRLHFARAPDIAWGLELRGNGLRIGWNSETYLAAVEQDLRQALDEAKQAEVPVGTG